MIKQLIKEAFILKSRGYYKHAIEALYKALEIDNTSPELLLEIAELYYLMGKEERALNYLQQVLDKNPTHIGSLELLKKIFLNKNALEEAEQTAKNIYCISKDSKNLVEVFKILNKEKKYKEIFDFHTEMETADTLYQKAIAKFALKDFDKAESLIDEALTKEKHNEILLLKGKILLQKNDDEGCQKVLSQMNILNSEGPILNFAGIVEQHVGNYNKALEYLKNAIKAEPQNDEYYYNCASTYFKMNDLQSAKKYYNLAISLAPQNPSYHFALANLYYAEQHYKRALEELDSNLYEARLLKSIILYDTGYLALARKELFELEKICPSDSMVTKYIGKIKEELEN